jgi:hypothetical protein
MAVLVVLAVLVLAVLEEELELLDKEIMAGAVIQVLAVVVVVQAQLEQLLLEMVDLLVVRVLHQA